MLRRDNHVYRIRTLFMHQMVESENPFRPTVTRIQCSRNMGHVMSVCVDNLETDRNSAQQGSRKFYGQ